MNPNNLEKAVQLKEQLESVEEKLKSFNKSGNCVKFTLLASMQKGDNVKKEYGLNHSDYEMLRSGFVAELEKERSEIIHKIKLL